MRILHVVEATTAGVRRHVFTLASAIDQSRFDVAVACPPTREQAFGDTGFVADLRRAGIPVFPVPMTRSLKPSVDARTFGELVGLLRREHFDLVHAHSSKAGFLGRLAARVAGVASVYTPHSLYFLGLNQPAKRRLFLLLEQFGARIGDRVIAVSPGERDLIIREGVAPRERVVCIENGVEVSTLPSNYSREAVRASLGQVSNGMLVGTVARLAQQKNPRLFLEAAARVLRNFPDARFVWCGSGDLQAQAQQWACEFGVAHAITFLGHREDVAEVVAALDVFWLSSNYEGMPNSLLEAMVLGVPIVATDVIGTRDLLRGSAGLLVPPADPESLANATLMLVNRPDRRTALVRTAKAWVNERWKAERMVRETEALYEMVLRERQAGRDERSRLTSELTNARP